MIQLNKIMDFFIKNISKSNFIGNLLKYFKGLLYSFYLLFIQITK